ncbi:molybdopterin oxidoreductase family protein [Vitiosangium sp. GDMCC 1.1324]|uniref:molybdopterin oxidoreductase family protein n=1 Tax=Vitiosangium sp. (strain GDMCC 1.1324) TaxID=2138576 RepID=UPI000D399708|nr:molybdopterin oxidoreductase family protein [Vitiosangium sp. GDMCC 1.1324]PTL78339.1 dehydrogenase [Vitiosangium sp. GDMCC 1.1324]
MTKPSSPSELHFRTCNLCEAMCGLRIETSGGRVTSIRGDEEDPFSKGHICPKAVALQDLHEDPDRLRQPVRRTANGWQPISWEEALDETARRLHAIQKEHGKESVGAYVGNPTVHDHGALIFLPMLLRALRTKNKFSASSVDQLPHQLVAYLMFGHQFLIPIPDIDHTRYMLILGANPLASNGSLMSAPGVRGRLKAIQQRGGRVVVVDPRKTETARAADEHVFIRPGTDALWLFSLLHVLLEETGPKLGRLAEFSDGLATVREVARDFTPERAALHTGVPADTTRRIARELSASESAVCYGRLGVSTQAFGAMCQWLINLINLVTGNFDREGGALFTKPAFDVVQGPRALAMGRGSFGRWRSRVRGLPEFSGDLPVAALGEEILTEGPGRIRAMLTSAGNPVVSTPNGRQLDKALESLDFMVSIDPYINETTRHAHIILPPSTHLERSHYDLAFHVLAVRNTAKYSPPLFPKRPDSKHDWEIFLELKHRLEKLRGAPRVQGELEYRTLKALGPDRLLDVALRAGPYGLKLRPFRKGLSLASLEAQPHGVDLGPLQPSLPGRLATRDRRIQLAPELLVADVQRLRQTYPADAPAPEEGTLLLIGRRHLRDNNSWLHNVPRLVSGKPRCTLMVHPDDARRLGLREGGEAFITSRVGEVKAPVTVTDEVMQGVVSLPHGYGHGREGVRLRVAGEHAGVSINDLTDDRSLDAISGNAAFSGVQVRIKPVESIRTEEQLEQSATG